MMLKMKGGLRGLGEGSFIVIARLQENSYYLSERHEAAAISSLVFVILVSFRLRFDGIPCLAGRQADLRYAASGVMLGL